MSRILDQARRAARRIASAALRVGPSGGILAALLALYGAVYLARGVRDPGAADGFYGYLHARSLAFDLDLDFRNDYALCGDPWAQGVDRGAGRVDNPGYLGPSVLWAPLILIARVIVHLPPDASAGVRAGCVGPIARFALASSVLLGAAAMVLAYRTARRFSGAGAAATAALLFGVASSLPQYAAIFVSSSHVHQCFAAALLGWLSVRAWEAPRLGRLALVGLALGLCALQRLSDVTLATVPLALLVSGAEPWSRKLRGALVIAAGGALGVLATLALYAHLYGSPLVLPQGRHYVHLGHSHPFLLLFAPHGGLFFATPIAWLGVVGLAGGLRRGPARPLAIGAALACVATVWIAAAPLDWHGKATFGARRLLVLTPLLVVFAARAIEGALPWIRRRATPLLAAAAVALLGAPVVGGALGTTSGEVPLDGGSQAEVYGGGVRALFGVVDQRLGDLAILPAEALFALRYGLPMRSFRAATTDRHYRRSYRDLSWEPNALDFEAPTLRAASKGTAKAPGGMRLVDARAKVVFTAGWPFATDAALDVEADAETRLALRLGRPFGRCELGERTVAKGRSTLRFSIPEGCFDSGLLELDFSAARGGDLVVRRLVLDDARAYAPPYGGR